jgi:hypothetical protein
MVSRNNTHIEIKELISPFIFPYKLGITTAGEGARVGERALTGGSAVSATEKGAG